MTEYSYQDYIWDDPDENDYERGEVELSTYSFLHSILFADWAEHTSRPLCHIKSPDGHWVCTRTEGHEGPHVGHTSDYVKGVWPNLESDQMTFDYPEKWDKPEPVPVERSTAIHDPWGWTMGDEG